MRRKIVHKPGKQNRAGGSQWGNRYDPFHEPWYYPSLQKVTVGHVLSLQPAVSGLQFLAITILRISFYCY